MIGDEKFDYVIDGDRATLTWNVTMAKALVEAGEVRATVAVDETQLRAIAERNVWSEARVATADPTLPGIGAPIIVDGRILYILIDGTHRAVKALRTGVVFEARLLTDRAARACLTSGPTERVP